MIWSSLNVIVDMDWECRHLKADIKWIPTSRVSLMNMFIDVHHVHCDAITTVWIIQGCTGGVQPQHRRKTRRPGLRNRSQALPWQHATDYGVQLRQYILINSLKFNKWASNASASAICTRCVCVCVCVLVSLLAFKVLPVSCPKFKNLDSVNATKARIAGSSLVLSLGIQLL